jgi:hypothetical protein
VDVLRVEGAAWHREDGGVGPVEVEGGFFLDAKTVRSWDGAQEHGELGRYGRDQVLDAVVV